MRLVKLSYCVYDNPATMSRECYCNGALVWAYTANSMRQKGNYAKAYPWISNQVIDNPKALPDKFFRIYMEY